MPTSIAQLNLERDKNVQGKQWFLTYGAYFSDEENIALFLDAVVPRLPQKPLDILYAASASGLLGERLLQRLGRGHLTIVDISQKHLDENKNPHTSKICADLLEMDLGKTFDLILMRSSLDYFPSEALQIQALRVIRRHLKRGGIFVNQPTFFADPQERDLMSRLYNTVETMGHRFFQSTDLPRLYHEAGLGDLEHIGEGKVLTITQADHKERYAISSADIKNIQVIIAHDRPHMQITEEGYRLQFDFPIFLASAP